MWGNFNSIGMVVHCKRRAELQVIGWYGMIIFIQGLRKVFAWLNPDDNSSSSPGYRASLCASSVCYTFFILFFIYSSIPEFRTVHKIYWTGASVVNALTKGITTVWRHGLSNTEHKQHSLLDQPSNHSATETTNSSYQASLSRFCLHIAVVSSLIMFLFIGPDDSAGNITNKKCLGYLSIATSKKTRSITGARAVRNHIQV